MSTPQPRAHRARTALPVAKGLWQAISIAAACTLISAWSPTLAAADQPKASASAVTLHHALAARTSAVRGLARAARQLRACLHAPPASCHAQRRAVSRDRADLERAERHLRLVEAHLSRTRFRPGGKEGSGSKERSGGGSSGGSTEEKVEASKPETTEPPQVESPEPSELESPEPVKGEPEPTKGEPEPTKGEPEPTKSEPETTAPSAFEMGVVSGSAIAWELPFVQKLGAHTARMEFSIDTPVSQIEPIVEAYAKAGVKPLLLAGFDGTMPSPAEARNLASWAAELGPAGNFWKGKTLPAETAVTDIEFGNETSYSYQYPDTREASDWYSLASYATRAQTYALRFKEAYEAIHATGAKVGLLAQADDGDSGSSEWVRNMFAAVPTLSGLVAGWTIHPYGPKWESDINRMISQTQSVGAPSSIPIYVTEWGLATDNGRCLDDNYGFNRCMTYGEASSTLQSSLSAMRARYGARLAALYLFQARDQQASGASSDREAYFGALQSDEQAKGAYTATVQSLLAANP